MKNFRTILTVILALFVLMSSISYSVSFHMCGGEVQRMAIFGHAQICEEHTRGCDHDVDQSNHISVGHKGCCEDATVVIETEKYSTKISESVTFKPFTDAFPLAVHVVDLNTTVAVELGHFFNYQPPLIERDITLFVQSFLI